MPEIRTKFTADYKQFLTDLDKINQGIMKVENTANKAGKKGTAAFSGIGAALRPLKGLFAGIGFSLLAKNFFDINRRVEDFRSSLVSVTGGGKKFEQQLKLLDTVTSKLPINIKTAENAFINLNGNGITPTEDLMTAFANAASITKDKVGALTAAVTVWSRSMNEGAVSLEELDKLSDRGIPVYKILAEQLGVTRGQLLEFSKETGNTKLVLDTLQKAFLSNPMFNGAAARDMKTTNGQLTQLNTNWDKFIVSLGNSSNSSSTFVTALEGINATLKLLTQNAGTVINVLAGIGSAVIIAGLVKVATSLKTINKIMKANPIGLLAFGLAAAITAGLEFIDNLRNIGVESGKLSKTFLGTFDVLGAIWDGVMGFMEDAFLRTVKTLKGAWKGLVDFFKRDITGKELMKILTTPSAEIEGVVERYEKALAKLQAARAEVEKNKPLKVTINKGVPEVIRLPKSLLDEQTNLKKLIAARKTSIQAYEDEKNAQTAANMVKQAGIELDTEAGKKTLELAKNIVKLKEDLEDARDPFQEAIEGMKVGIDDLANFWTNRFKGMEDALVDFVKTGKLDWRGLLDSMTEELIRFYLRLAIFGSNQTGGFGGIGSIFSGISSIFSEKGNVFQNGNVQMFEKGGVMTQPFAFPMNGGKTGIGAEAGPEAIMPLKRDGQGNLGVAATGGMGGNTTNIYFDGIRVSNTNGASPKEIGESIAIYVEEQLVRGRQVA